MNPDDPKLTAYAVDELDPAERAEIDTLLRENPDALAEVEQTERLIAQLRRELQAEPAAPLHAQQREEVFAAAVAAAPPPSVVRAAPSPREAEAATQTLAHRRWSHPLLLAASIAVLGGVTYLTQRSLRQPAAHPVAMSWHEASSAPSIAAGDSRSWQPKPEEIRLDAEVKLSLAQLSSTETPVTELSAGAPAVGGINAPGQYVAQDADQSPPVLSAPTLPQGAADSLLAKNESSSERAKKSDFTIGETAAAAEEARRVAVSAASAPLGDRTAAADATKRYFIDAEGFYQTGRYDLALKRTEQILAEDPSNIAARAMQERVNKAISDYGIVSYNETRSRSVTRNLDEAWVMPVRKFSLGDSKVSAQSKAPPDAGAFFANAGTSSGLLSESLKEVADESLISTARPMPTLAATPRTAMTASVSGATNGLASLTTPANASTASPAEAPSRSRGVVAQDSRGARSDDILPLMMEKRAKTIAGLPDGAARGQADEKAKVALQAGGRRGGAPEAPASRLADAATTASRAERDVPAVGDIPNLGSLFGSNQETGERRIHVQREASNTEAYDAITDNVFLAVGENPLSTFSIDVDTASYSNVRRFLSEQRLPPKGAVRIEELLNYFTYDYPQPEGDAPFSASMEVAACPWTPEHRLVRIGLKGREIAPEKRPATNLVFLVDVSGSMQPENKLSLVKKCLRQLVDKMGDEDSVAIAVYAGAGGCVLEPTNKKSEMRRALDRLESGGSTNGAAGIQLAYQLAEKSFIKGGVNRVILATDGDFNVGVTNQSDLTELIEKKAKSGVFLTVLGFGMGNLKDSTLEKLADKGNGNYAYIDTLNEGRKVLVEQMNGTLVTIAKDVKIQVEFNPAQVGSYRLIGYENRMLKKEDFNDDTKDAGEIGAGHTVTALYEVVPAGTKPPGAPGVDSLKYQESGVRSQESEFGSSRSGKSSELLTLKLRYKAPDGDTSKLLEFPLTDDGKSYERSSKDFRFAAAVASFGMLLRDSPHKGKANWSSTLELALEGKGEDRSGYRAEFVSLIERAKAASR